MESRREQKKQKKDRHKKQQTVVIQEQKYYQFEWDNPDYFEEVDILSLLPTKKLKEIKECFKKEDENGDDGLEIEDFLLVMHQHLNLNLDQFKTKKEARMFEIKVTISLINLFEEIDVNGDENMEWDEFSNHIIELGLIKQDKDISGLVKNYYPNDTIKDTVKHESLIEKLYYFRKPGYIVCIEKDNPVIKIFDPLDAHIIQVLDEHKGAVLAADYIPDYNYLATCSNDLTIYFWDATTFNLRQRISTPEVQLCMKYVNWNNPDEKIPSKMLLYTGGSDAIIHVYELTNMKEYTCMQGWNPFFKKDIEQKGHSGPIQAIIPLMEGQKQLVTAALDGKICLWDITNHSFKKSLDGHKNGLYSLTERRSQLISAGLDHDVIVWNPYVNDPIYRLQDHCHPLVGVEILEGTPQLISVDIKGTVKVWDIRTFQRCQSFTSSLKEVTCFCLTYPQKKIILGGKKLEFFDYDEPKDQLLTDEKICLQVLFNDTLFSLITLHPDSIKVWDARTGFVPRNLYHGRETQGNELTKICLDNRERKLFVGDSEGELFTVNVNNGARMMDFDRHYQSEKKKKGASITTLAYVNPAEYEGGEDVNSKIGKIISASTHPPIRIHDDDAEEETGNSQTTKDTIQQQIGAVTGLSIRGNYLASCSDDGSVIITYMRLFKTEKIWRDNYQPKQEFMHCRFLKPHDCLTGIDKQGGVYFWTVKPSLLQDIQIGKKNYQAYSFLKVLSNFYVTCYDFYMKKRWIILGDEFGNVSVWNCQKLMEFLDFLHKDKTHSLNTLDNKQTLIRILQFEIDAYKEHCQKVFVTQMRQNMLQELEMLQQNMDIDDIRKMLKEKLKQMQKPGYFEQIFDGYLVKESKEFKSFKAHKTLITSIAVMEDYDCFATSSFDCCVYIWDLSKENVKLGSLMLGMDTHWYLGLRLKNIEHDRKKEIYQAASKYLDAVKKVTPKQFMEKFDFDDSKYCEEENPILTKNTRKKISNAKSYKERILLKANALRQLHKEKQMFGDDFMQDDEEYEDVSKDLDFDEHELEQDLMQDLNKYGNYSKIRR